MYMYGLGPQSSIRMRDSENFMVSIRLDPSRFNYPATPYSFPVWKNAEKCTETECNFPHPENWQLRFAKKGICKRCYLRLFQNSLEEKKRSNLKVMIQK